MGYNFDEARNDVEVEDIVDIPVKVEKSNFIVEN